jgi:hypothetical protein
LVKIKIIITNKKLKMKYSLAAMVLVGLTSAEQQTVASKADPKVVDS